MNLKLLLPNRVLLDEDVTKVTAEAENGSFCLLPRHVDFVAALVPGILTYVDAGDDEKFLAVDEGILVKVGSDVLVSIRSAVQGTELGRLREAVEQRFLEFDEREQRARSAVARLESSVVRHLLETQQGV
jgi:F-type H+-transporting ATPase subunit epsilon